MKVWNFDEITIILLLPTHGGSVYPSWCEHFTNPSRRVPLRQPKPTRGYRDWPVYQVSGRVVGVLSDGPDESNLLTTVGLLSHPEYLFWRIDRCDTHSRCTTAPAFASGICSGRPWDTDSEWLFRDGRHQLLPKKSSFLLDWVLWAVSSKARPRP